MISFDNICVSFNGTNLFSNVTFMLNARERVGLVGKNGAGKSTLLKIAKGLQQPTSGQVATPEGVTIGYLPQIMKVADNQSVIEETMTAFEQLQRWENKIAHIAQQLNERTDYESPEYMKLIEELTEYNDKLHVLGGDSRQGDAEKALLGLGFKRSDLARATREFSGGWRMRIELAKILLQRPDVLLLDEPTNHLDIESIQWLEDYLKTYTGSLILISHDRAFLDAVTTRTVELVLGTAHDYNVPYSRYVVLRKERREQQMATYQNQQRTIEKNEEFIERFRYKASKSNQVQSRIKMLEKIDRVEIDDEDASAMNIKFPPAPRSGNMVYEAKDVTKRFDNKVIFEHANISVQRGERIAFVGRNGEGKTTMSRILVGKLEYEAGESRIGHNVNIGYFAQNQDDLMNGEFTVLDTLDNVAKGDIRTKLRDILGAFLFRGEDVDKKVKVLSGGERSRLAMARLMLEPYNLLVLDEPTNHMDMRSKDILKAALMKYDGTLIVVSHDREFLDGLVNKIYEFRDGRVKEHLGTIWEFMNRLKINQLKEIEVRAENQKKAEPEAAKPTKEQHLQKKEQTRSTQKQLKRQAELEQEVARLDAAVAEMDTTLGNHPELATPDFFERYAALKKQQEEAMWQWMQGEQ
ncbi:ABC transporter ATP-binding protein [Bacteroidia bacterium]|nr:ABC transporter ATP-binding protein [Bacteroidia bacterium]